MSILTRALGPNPPADAQTRFNIVRDLIDEKNNVCDVLGLQIREQEKTVENKEYDAVLSAASKDDVRAARELLVEMTGELKATRNVIKDLEAELPALEKAAKKEAADKAAAKKAALAAQKTISADIDAALQAQADYETAVLAAQHARDKVIDELAQVTPDAARMVRGGGDADAILERAQQELEAQAEGISITEFDLRLGALRTEAAKRNDALEEIDLDGPSVFMTKSEPIEQTAESLQVPQQSRWDPEQKRMVAI